MYVYQVNIAYQSGKIYSVVDANMGSYPSECVEKFATLALNCCWEDTDGRPSMAEVVREIENIWQMMLDLDPRTIDSVDITEPVSSQCSSLTKNMFLVSSDISGNDLSSGVIPTISPR